MGDLLDGLSGLERKRSDGMAKNREEKIEDLILKVARGFQLAEVTEEFVEVDGEMKLTKRKKTKKDIPPDWKALQLLIGSRDDGIDFSAMSDEELEAERERLLNELQSKGGVKRGDLRMECEADGVGVASCDESAQGEKGKRSVDTPKAKRPKPRKKKPTVLNGGKK
jgi:hypothetical protein